MICKQYDCIICLCIYQRYGDDDSQIRTYTHIIHPEYNYGNVDNDVCLLRLDEPLNLTKPAEGPVSVKPIKLNRREDFSGENFVVSGWGTLEVSFK